MAPATPSAKVQYDYQVIVIGSGFSGINMGIELKDAGIDDFVIFEQAGDIGGTWRDNTYPGCACDVPSYLYSYSFEPSPEWSSVYSGSEEIQQYLRHCAQKYGVMPHVRLNTEVVGCEFDQQRGIWTVCIAGGAQYTARVVVSAVGGLVNPAWPDLPGRDRFRGEVMHTARWKHEVSLTGKKVAVVGTGASAIQVVPAIQPRVARLLLFQRTAPWVLPKVDPTISHRAKQLFRRLPLAQKAVRGGILALSELVFAPMVILDSPLQKILERMARRNLNRVKDKSLRKKLTPNFHIGCKRVLFSSDYYDAVQQENVEVIDDGVAAFTETGMRAQDGREVDADVVVMATGFRIDIDNAPFEVIGLDGCRLTQLWQQPGGKAYKGVAVSGIPNFFLMLGPNTGPGHTSVLIYTEAQAAYITQAVCKILETPLRYLTVRRDVLRRYHEKLQNRMRFTSWTSGCQSWYLDENGENHTLFPGLASEYALSLRKLKLNEYELGYWDSAGQEGVAS